MTMTNKDSKLIHDIVSRAEKLTLISKPLTVDVNIAIAHCKNPLRLRDWLLTDDGNFMHDIMGICKNINRKTGEMKNCFLPRFSS